MNSYIKQYLVRNNSENKRKILVYTTGSDTKQLEEYLKEINNFYDIEVEIIFNNINNEYKKEQKRIIQKYTNENRKIKITTNLNMK